MQINTIDNTMTTDSLLEKIIEQNKALLDRIESLEQTVKFYNDPAATMSLQERSDNLVEAIRSGDKARIKLAKKNLNAR